MSDKDIIDLIIAGNEEAMLYLLYDRYEKDLEFYAWRYCHSLVYLEDLANYLYIQLKGKYSAGFFNLADTLHGKASLMITTNKALTEWAKTLKDKVLASAILDRLLYHYEVIKLSGQSYRMRYLQLKMDIIQ